jgi:hypothetical protein
MRSAMGGAGGEQRLGGVVAEADRSEVHRCVAAVELMG